MYKDIGNKVKGLAVVMAVLGAIGAFIGGLAMMDALGGVAILIALLGPVMMVLFSWPLYAFGELVSQTTSINEKLDGIAGGASVKKEQKKEDNAQRKQKLDALLASGSISEQEYHLALSKM